MNRSKAPILATWLLTHLTFGRDEALAGDLLEEFATRSRGWYWRQVLVAIFTSFQNEVRTEWNTAGKAVVLTFGFAVVWNIVVVEVSRHLNFNTSWVYAADAWLRRSIIVSRWTFFGPMGWIWMSIVLAPGIAIFLRILGSWSVKNLARGLLSGLTLFILHDFALHFFLRSFGLNLWRVLSFLWDWFFWVPLFAAVLLSVWMAQPRESRWGKNQHGPKTAA